MTKPGDPFLKHVATLLVGNGIAQALPILAALFLSRVYTPADMGAFALYMLLPTNLSVLATGRYDMAIVIPKEDDDALNVLALSTLISFGFAVLALLIVLAFRDALSQWLQQPAAVTLLLLVPVSVFLTGAVQAAFAWLNRKKAYRFSSAVRVAQSIATVFTTVGLGYLGFRVLGLVVGALAGLVVGALALLVHFARSRAETPWRTVAWSRIKSNARTYEDFPKVNSFHVLIDLVQTNLVTLGIGHGFGQAALGHYSFTTRVLKTPLGMIGSAVGQVFYQQASETMHQQEDLSGLTRGVVRQLAYLAVPAFAVILLFGPELFALVFGASWRTAGVYAQLLGPWLAFNFVVSPITAIYVLKGQQRTALLFGAADCVLKALPLGLGLLTDSVYIGLIGMSVGGVGVLVFYLRWCLAIAKAPARVARNAEPRA